MYDETDCADADRQGDVVLLAGLLGGNETQARKTARRLIERFGSLARILNAEPDEIPLGESGGDAALGEIRRLRRLADAIAMAELRAAPVPTEPKALMRYCRIRLLGSSREQLHAIYLDRALRPVAGKCLQTGTVDHVTVYPREILAMALRHGATAIVLAHNHPSGNPQPSRADIAMTKLVEEAALPFGIAIVDHIIVGNQGNFSFRQYGLLRTTA